MGEVSAVQKVSLGLVILYVIILAKVMFHGGEANSVGWFVLGAFFLSWASAPMITFFFLISKATAMLKKMIFLTVQVVFFILTTYIYYDAFYVNLDAQNGILFFVLPIWQYIGIAIVISAIKVIESVVKFF